MYFLKLRYTICLGGRDVVENISQRYQKGRKWAIFSGVLCHSPQKHNFDMHICGFDFDVVNMEDDSFFLEDRFPTFDRDLKNKKTMVPINPEGVHGQPLWLPDY